MTRKEKVLLSIGITGLAFTFVIAGVSNSVFTASKYSKSSGLDHYTLTLDSSNAPSSLTSSYQENVTANYTTDNGNSLSLNFVKAKAASGKHVDLASHGMIYNFASENGGISGITAITVTYSGSTMGLKTSLANALSNGTAIENSYSVSSGTRLELPSPRYFSLVAADGGNVITSIVIEYSCSLNEDVARLNGEYSGTGNDDYRYSLTLNNGAVTLHTLDNHTEITASGTATLSGNNLTCSFTSPSSLNGLVYNFTADAQSHALTYVSKSGTGSGNVPQVSFYRVYTVEDFESYDAVGTGWDLNSNYTQYQATGLKGDYVCEYYKSGSTAPIGGTDWSLMGSSDYIVYSATAGHNNSKTIGFKGNNNQMHFIQASGYYGVPRVIGKGNKLSFWSKGAFSNAAMTNASTYVANVTVYAFYTQQVSNATLTQRTEKAFLIANSNVYEEYTMDLDPSKTYYSIGIYITNKDSAARYLAMDDFKIYSSCPYGADLTETPSGNFKGTATKNSGSYTVLAFLGSHNQVNFRIAGTVYPATYTASGNSVSIATSDSWIGTLTGTYNKASNSITGCSFSGTIKNEIKNNGSLTLSELPNTWHCDEDSLTARSTFKRRYMSGSWQVDSGNDDRLMSINYASISNGHAIRRRGYTGGAVALNLGSDLDTAVTVQNICFWVYNPSSSDITLRNWVYKAKNFGSNVEVSGSVPAAAGTWTFISLGFTQCAVYNWQLADFTNSGAALAYDNISLY